MSRATSRDTLSGPVPVSVPVSVPVAVPALVPGDERDATARHPGAAPLAAVLAGAAVLASAWPLHTLFTQAPWETGAVAQVCLVGVLGVLLRMLGRGPATVAVVQLAGVVLAQSVLFPGQRPVVGGLLPTPATVAAWRDLASDAVATITAHATPAPVTPGVTFVIVAGVALVAWAVDVVAVSSRLPAVAALPLLTPLLTTVANSAQPLDAQDVALPIALWCALLVENGRTWLSSWRPDLAASGRLPGRRGRVGLAAGVCALALAAGVGAGGALPRLSAHYLTDGWGAQGFGSQNQVGFSPDTDMLNDLRDDNSTPVLVYTTDDPQAPPLRVSVATIYDAGAWRAAPVDAEPSAGPQLPFPMGLTSAVPRTEPSITVQRTTLSAPYLASPTPIVSGTVVGARWAADERTGAPVVDRIPRSYQLRYLSLAPTPDQLRGGSPIQRSAFAAELAVPSAANTDLLRTTTTSVVSGARTPFEKAAAIQSWLREDGGFTYSLELAAPPPDMSQKQAANAALDLFLTSQRGYCVQFTTAMVMMARREGIPARVATGFLPGEPEGAARTVRVSDAHAWPELYFTGVGWLRFEPTPSQRSGATPSYAGGDAAPDPAPQGTAGAVPTRTTSQPAPSATPRSDPDTGAPDPAAADDGAARLTAVLVALGAFGALAVALAVAASLVPFAGRRALARRRGAARSPGERAEVEWAALRDGLEDLGVAVPPDATPRQLIDRLSRAAALDEGGRAALARVLSAVERARYAPPKPSSPPYPPGGGATRRASAAELDAVGRPLAADARMVLNVTSSLRSTRVRARARLLPRAGLRALHLPIPAAWQPVPSPDRRTRTHVH